MGDTYNNVRATGLVARSNHYCTVIMGDNIIFGQLGGDNWVVMDRMFVEYTLVNQPLWDHPLLDQALLDRATRPVAPTFRLVDVIELRFDKMSNEGGYNVIPRTKIRFGGFGGTSRAIRKIHIDAGRGIGTILWAGLGTDGCPFSVSGFLYPSFYYLPIC